jgi:adenylate kinase
MSATRVVFLGPPGAGKGTQAQRFAASVGIPHLSTGDMLRKAMSEGTPIGLQAKPIVDSGKLIPDEMMWGVVAERLGAADCRAGFLLDGFPRTTAQATTLDAKLVADGTPLTCAVSLDVPEAELVKRMLARGRADDTPETVRTRLQVYERQTAPLKDWFQSRGLLREIDGTGTPEQVYERLLVATGVSP